MSVTSDYLNAIADNGNPITYIALFDDGGTELSGGSPAYARQAVTWTAAVDGLIRPNADLEFDIPSGATVYEWRGFGASVGGDSYGGALLTPESFASQNTYTLLASETGIRHDPV